MTMTDALLERIRAFPDFEALRFGALGDGGEPAMVPLDGAAAESAGRSVTGRTWRVGLYPFAVVLPAGGPEPDRQARIKEALEALGAWLEAWTDMPAPEDGVRLLSAGPTGAAHIDRRTDGRTELWVLPCAARCRIER